MANRRVSGANKEYAIVDTLPTSAGYFTNHICPRDKKGEKVFFSIRETNADISANPSALSSITVILQFLCPGDSAWTDFINLDGSAFVIGNRVELQDIGAGVLWRAGVRDDEYINGAVTFGFDW